MSSEQPPSCKDDPRAPHGFLRDTSHILDRYVCECELWEPEDDFMRHETPHYVGFKPLRKDMYED